jgi:hypothetical protein
MSDVAKIGVHCPINLHEYSRFDPPPIVRLSRRLVREVGDLIERGERINGYVQCPNCDLWWPCVEEPDCWTEQMVTRWFRPASDRFVTYEKSDNGWLKALGFGEYREVPVMVASGWWGAAYCDSCGLLMAEQPDGRLEAYYL